MLYAEAELDGGDPKEASRLLRERGDDGLGLGLPRCPPARPAGAPEDNGERSTLNKSSGRSSVLFDAPENPGEGGALLSPHPSANAGTPVPPESAPPGVIKGDMAGLGRLLRSLDRWAPENEEESSADAGSAEEADGDKPDQGQM